MTRKYQTEQKTTTPNGYREYKKLQMRDRRKQDAEIEQEARAFAEVLASKKAVELTKAEKEKMEKEYLFSRIAAYAKFQMRNLSWEQKDQVFTYLENTCNNLPGQTIHLQHFLDLLDAKVKEVIQK